MRGIDGDAAVASLRRGRAHVGPGSGRGVELPDRPGCDAVGPGTAVVREIERPARVIHRGVVRIEGRRLPGGRGDGEPRRPAVARSVKARTAGRGRRHADVDRGRGRSRGGAAPVEEDEGEAVGRVAVHGKGSDLIPGGGGVRAFPEPAATRPEVERTRKIGIDGEPLTDRTPVDVAAHRNGDGVRRPGVPRVGRAQDDAVAAGQVFAGGHVDDAGLHRVRRDALDSLEVRLIAPDPVGDRRPLAGGRVPAVGASDVGASVNEAALQGTEDDAGDEAASQDGDVLPGIGRGGSAFGARLTDGGRRVHAGDGARQGVRVVQHRRGARVRGTAIRRPGRVDAGHDQPRPHDQPGEHRTSKESKHRGTREHKRQVARSTARSMELQPATTPRSLSAARSGVRSRWGSESIS